MLEISIEKGELIRETKRFYFVLTGVSMEGTMMSVREGVNLQFYGRPACRRAPCCWTTAAPPPAAASALYAALDALMDWAASLPAPAGFLTTRCRLNGYARAP